MTSKFRRLSPVARCATVLATFMWMASTSLPTLASTIVFNTTSGTFTVNGSPATQINGVNVLDGGLSGGVRTMNVVGDLHLLSTDTLSAIGSDGLSILAGNNIQIDSGAVINILAGNNGGGAGAGGGAVGGSAGTGGNGGGAGG